MGHDSSNSSMSGNVIAFGSVFLAIIFLILVSDLNKPKHHNEQEAPKTEQTTH